MKSASSRILAFAWDFAVGSFLSTLGLGVKRGFLIGWFFLYVFQSSSSLGFLTFLRRLYCSTSALLLAKLWCSYSTGSCWLGFSSSLVSTVRSLDTKGCSSALSFFSSLTFESNLLALLINLSVFEPE